VKPVFTGNKNLPEWIIQRDVIGVDNGHRNPLVIHLPAILHENSAVPELDHRHIGFIYTL
jgi:hypothetical protein